MTDRELDADFDPDHAFAGLRSAVRKLTQPPPPAAVRARAERRQRNRRAAAAFAAAAAVVVVTLVGANLTRIDAAPTPPPAATESTAPTPTPWASPPAPRPSLSVPVRPVTMVDDPIADVDWNNATITVPAREGCPSGRLRFQAGGTAGYPKMTYPYSEDGVPVDYGDLVGDGRPEAVIEAICIGAEEGAHWPSNLLVIERRGDGSLRGIAWVGPAELSIYRETWITGRTLYTEQQWSEPGYEFSAGAAAAYRWVGSAFARVESGLSGVETLAPDKPTVELGSDADYVPRALGCPGGGIVFEPPTSSFRRVQRGYVYSVERLPGEPPYLADLAGDGHRYVLVALRCQEQSAPREEASERGTGYGILVLDRTADGFRAVDVVTRPPEYSSMEEWQVTDGRLTVVMYRDNATATENVAFVWNGRYFQR